MAPSCSTSTRVRPPPNQAALAVYGARPLRVDHALASGSRPPASQHWCFGQKAIGPVYSDYGRPFADALPTARLQLLAGTGHIPKIRNTRAPSLRHTGLRHLSLTRTEAEHGHFPYLRRRDAPWLPSY